MYPKNKLSSKTQRDFCSRLSASIFFFFGLIPFYVKNIWPRFSFPPLILFQVFPHLLLLLFQEIGQRGAARTIFIFWPSKLVGLKRGLGILHTNLVKNYSGRGLRKRKAKTRSTQSDRIFRPRAKRFRSVLLS